MTKMLRVGDDVHWRIMRVAAELLLESDAGTKVSVNDTLMMLLTLYDNTRSKDKKKS